MGMLAKKVMFPVLLLSFTLLACRYIVLPEGLEDPSEGRKAENLGWAGIVTSVSESGDGNLRIEITIRNDTGDWSTMRAVDGKPATLRTGDGGTTNCDTVFVGTGGHRLAPGFQARGYTSGSDDQPETQLLYVECEGAVAAPGSSLLIDYVHFDGALDYYVEIE
jgi:hypothetical protein